MTAERARATETPDTSVGAVGGPWLSDRAAAGRVGVHPNTIAKWRATGLPFAQRGRVIRKLPHVRLHSLRHSAAMAMVDVSGGDIVAVSRVLGHSTIGVTVDTYGRESDAARKCGATYMDRAMGRRVTSGGGTKT